MDLHVEAGTRYFQMNIEASRVQLLNNTGGMRIGTLAAAAVTILTNANAAGSGQVLVNSNGQMDFGITSTAPRRMTLTSTGVFMVGTGGTQTDASSIAEFQKDQDDDTTVVVENTTAGTSSAAGNAYVGVSGTGRSFVTSPTFTTASGREQNALNLEAGTGLSGGININAREAAPILFKTAGIESARFTTDGTPAYKVNTNTQLVETQNDYDIGDNKIHRIDATSAVSITGITDGFEGKELTIVNFGSAAITFTNEDAASTAANRIITGTGASVVLGQDDVLNMFYDDTSSRWRVTSVQQ